LDYEVGSLGITNVGRGWGEPLDDAPLEVSPLSRHIPLQVIHLANPYEMPDSHKIVLDECQIIEMLTSLCALDPNVSQEDAIHLIQAN